MSAKGQFKFKRYNGQCMVLLELADSTFLKRKANPNFICYQVSLEQHKNGNNLLN
jgi:hypothetical protein